MRDGVGGSLNGDGLVLEDSALGSHASSKLTLAFPEAHQWTGTGLGHLDLLDNVEVYDTILAWLNAPVIIEDYS